MFKNAFARVRTPRLALLASAVPAVLVSAGANAAGPDFTALTGAVDFTTTTAAILAIAALLVVVYLAIKGARTILHMVKGG